jgi:DNA-binding NtrC family response regulator
MEGRSDGTPLHVLIVDDEEGVRATLAANLELSGFVVSEAASVAAAVTILAAGRIDAVVSDVRMPDRDGLAGLGDYRAASPGVPVVFVTGYDEDTILEDAVARGAYTVLGKPVSSDRVADVVRRAVAHPVVLVVDDDAAFLDGLSENLRLAGLEVHVAADAAEAIEVAERLAVDVCVVDLLLGTGDDGAVLTARLRAALPAVAVITMTGYDVEDLVRRAARAGAAQCLRKPFDTPALTRLIARARRRGAPVASSHP